MASYAKQLLADKYWPISKTSRGLSDIKALRESFLKSDSMTGRTTRIIDTIVQELLETGHAHIQDHTNTLKADIELLNKVKTRMANEHPMFIVKYKDCALSIDIIEGV